MKIFKDSRQTEIVLCLALILAILALFWQVQYHEFVNFDDNIYVTENDRVKSQLTTENVKWAFKSSYFGNWYPLTLLSHMLDYQLYGLNPKGHHFNNLLLHILNTLLLFIFFKRATKSLWQSAFIAALFAFHPMSVEPVAWISTRKDVLSTFFWMMTLLSYGRYTEKRSIKNYLLALLFFCMGLMSKPMLLTLPCILVLLDYWPLYRWKFRKSGSKGDDQGDMSKNHVSFINLLLEKWPFFLFSVAFSIIAFVSQLQIKALPGLDLFPFNVRVANALVSYMSYIYKMFWPAKLAVFYPHHGMPPLWEAMAGGLLIAGISFAAVRGLERHPYFAVGWLWYIIGLLPVIGLVQIGTHSGADRYAYVPLIGLFIVISWGAPSLIAKWRHQKSVMTFSAGLIIPILMICTWIQLRHWKNSITLYEHSLRVTSNNYFIHNNLGSTFYRQGRMEEAIVHYSRSIQINPHYSEAHYNLGIALVKQNKFKLYQQQNLI